MKTTAMKQDTALDYRKRVCQAMNYISQNLDKELSLEEVADAAAFSMFHFHRIFKAVAGETVAGFVRRLRLEKGANNLLANSTLDITTIALETGFSSSQNFAKAFKQKYGMSPTEFRKSKGGNKVRNLENALSLKSSYDPDSVTKKQSMAERRKRMQVEIKEMSDFYVAYVRKQGPYGPETCGQAFDELCKWAGPKGFLNSGTVLGVYWDNPEVTPAEKCRTDACVTVPDGTTVDGQVATQTITSGKYAVCHFEITCEGFFKAWEDAFAWLIDSGHECDDKPCYELYHNNGEEHPEGKWIVDICIPLK